MNGNKIKTHRANGTWILGTTIKDEKLQKKFKKSTAIIL